MSALYRWSLSINIPSSFTISLLIWHKTSVTVSSRRFFKHEFASDTTDVLGIQDLADES